MAFSGCSARSFTPASVQNNAPEASGVYGLSNAIEWVLIGETSNIRARLMEHLTETDTAIANRQPTGFAFEICPPSERFRRQGALVRQLKPVCNRRIDFRTNRSPTNPPRL
jgi:hypothetical protein